MVSHSPPALPTPPVYQSTLFGFPIPAPIVIPCDGDPLDEHDSAIAALTVAYANWSAAQSLMAEAQAALHLAISRERHTRAALRTEA
jgi:hypothetical protein